MTLRQRALLIWATILAIIVVTALIDITSGFDARHPFVRNADVALAVFCGYAFGARKDQVILALIGYGDRLRHVLRLA